ncbi:MAG: hypothetical protein HFG26_01240 [Provencibacterium sp.]|jgi:hypothetical protein|nr:hypothetical protein [Provencibacterium sp.]
MEELRTPEACKNIFKDNDPDSIRLRFNQKWAQLIALLEERQEASGGSQAPQ